jgi:TonB family protein
MFTNLLASVPKRGRVSSSPAWATSVVLHLLVVAFVLLETTRSVEPEVSTLIREPVTFVEIPEEETPEPRDQEPEAEQPDPEPPVDRPAQPKIEMTRADLPAGYQVLATPIDVVGIPAPGRVEIRAEDFSGRGIVGGVEGGRPLVAMSAGPGAAPVADSAPLSVAVVDEPPRLSNRAEIGYRMEELYPPSFRMAGIEAELVIWFVVDTNGRVETSELRIVSETRGGFEAATRQLARLMRFEPARRNGQPVRVWVEQPLIWTVAR